MRGFVVKKLLRHRVSYLANLKVHTATVNVVKWSPDGNLLASASDDGYVIIWRELESTNTNEDAGVGIGSSTNHSSSLPSSYPFVCLG